MTDSIPIATAVANMGPGWIIGHAAHTNEEFFQAGEHGGGRQMFRRGCFEAAAARGAVLAIDHAVCHCRMPGRSPQEPLEQLLNWDLVYASTQHGSLLLAEDPYGLFFAALVDPRETVWYEGDRPHNVHAAVAGGVEVSIHIHGGAKAVDPNIPDGLRVLVDVNLVEISLLVLLPQMMRSRGGGSPGTWALPAGAAATAMLARRVGSAATR